MPRLPALVFGALLLTGGTATAQARGDISAGYRLMRAEGVSYPAGWYVDLTGHVHDVISIVGDIGGNYRSDSVSIGSFTQSVDAQIHTVMGGLKVNASTRDPDVIVFGQALVGGAKLDVTSTAGTVTLSRSTTGAALNLSAGVDVNGDLPVALRFQIGWFRVFEEGGGSNAFHFSVGAKIGL